MTETSRRVPAEKAAAEKHRRPVVQRCGLPGCPCHDAHGAVGDMVQGKPVGSPLPATTRSFMESGFGRDFGDVRVHTGPQAAGSADRLNARAFTSGRDIFFGAGQYNPGTTAGQGLLAHELTHVVQQRSGRAPADGIDHPGDPYELEAEEAARAVVSGQPASLTQAAVPGPPQLAKGPTKDPCPKYLIPSEKGPDSEVDQLFMAMEKRLVYRKGDRPDTETMRRSWLKKHGSPIVLDRLMESPGWPTDSQGTACEIEHIVEWSLHGDNPGESERPANLTLLGKSRNSRAGNKTKQQLEALRATNCSRFVGAEREPAQPVDECMMVDRNFPTWLNEHQKKGPGQIFFVLKFGKSRIPVDLSNAKQTAGAGGGVTYTGDLATLAGIKGGVKGILLDQISLTLLGDKLVTDGAIQARIRDTIAKPMQMSVTPVVVVVKAADGTLWLDPTKTKTTFPGLSETTFVFASTPDGDIEGKALLIPSKPLLNKTVINLLVRDGELTARLQVPVGQLNLPVPGLTLSGEGLTIGFENGGLFASGQLLLTYGTVARAELKAQATKDAFSAVGRVVLTIPGIDRATGDIWYREGELGGRVQIGADKLNVPGLRSADLLIDIQQGLLTGTGTALLAVPGLDNPTLSLAYRDGGLEGSARAGLKIPGLEGGAVELRYAKGALTGSGTIAYRKGKLSGTVAVVLSERHRLSGGGELAYELAPGLAAFAGMTFTEDGRTRISGGLRVPETVDLFPLKQIEKPLFKLPRMEIPLLAVPLGPRSVGIVATIDARLVARAGIGPGQLRKATILSDFNSSEPEAAFTFQAAGELYVPASAELAMVIAGGIGVSLAIARAVGGIEAEGAAGLQGAFSAAAALDYRAGRLAVSGLVALEAQPRLAFRLKAFVAAEADLFVTTIELYRKEWQLASVEAGAALKVGVRVPFTYVLGEPFALALDQVQFIVPPIEPVPLVKELLRGGGGVP
ncbi:eCIS core domain-containing protein [Streptomyces sp. UC4497]